MGVAMQGLSKISRAPIIKIIGYRAHRAVIFAIAWHLVSSRVQWTRTGRGEAEDDGPHFSKGPIFAPIVCLRIHQNTPLNDANFLTALHSPAFGTRLDPTLK